MCGAVASCRSGSSCRLELVRRGCADRNPSRAPPRRSGFALASLRRRPPATAFRPRSGAAPPRDGVSASPWSRPPCDGAPTSLWSCASATAYRHRSGAASPRDSVSTPLWGPRPLPWRRAPALYPPLGTTTLTLALGATALAGGHDPALALCPPGSGRFSRRDAATRAALGAMTFRPEPRSGALPPLWGRAMRKTVAFGRWRSKRTVFRGLGSEKWTILPVVRVGAFR